MADLINRDEVLKCFEDRGAYLYPEDVKEVHLLLNEIIQEIKELPSLGKVKEVCEGCVHKRICYIRQEAHNTGVTMKHCGEAKYENKHFR